MLFEFLNIKSITEELFFNKTNSMIDKLMKYFSVQDFTEKTKAHIIEKLFHELRNKKIKENIFCIIYSKRGKFKNILLIVLIIKSFLTSIL